LFGIGLPELLVILVLALIIFGPGKLPDVGKALGRSIGEFKKATKEAQDAVKLDEAESAKGKQEGKADKEA